MAPRAQGEVERRYDTDLSDDQWEILRPLVEREYHGPGRPRTVDLRDVVNALLDLVRTGCQWKMLPKDFPNHNSVRYYFDKWTYDGTWFVVNETLCSRIREEAGRAAYPSGGIIDSQRVKTTEAGGERGYDGGKKIRGRKRHIVVETLGNWEAAVVTAADGEDRDGGDWLFLVAPKIAASLKKLWADQKYRGAFVEWMREDYAIDVEVVKRADDQVGFVVLPRRWVVERT